MLCRHLVGKTSENYGILPALKWNEINLSNETGTNTLIFHTRILPSVKPYFKREEIII